MTPKPESETDHEQAIRDYYAHCDQAEHAEAAELPPVPNIIAALDTGTATPELISEWANHPYVCTTDIIRRAIAALLAARAAEAAQHRQEMRDERRKHADCLELLNEKATERNAFEETIRQQAEQMAALKVERDRLKAALERLRDCDWTIGGRGDRMDAVRDIARAALTPQGQSTDGETR